MNLRQYILARLSQRANPTPAVAKAIEHYSREPHHWVHDGVCSGCGLGRNDWNIYLFCDGVDA
jgi:hypothetical protein